MSRRSRFDRRGFFRASAVGAGLLGAGGPAPSAVAPHLLAEHGFWDYTTPGAGGMERYRESDYLTLLDDMAQSGMNSLLIYLKWLTTGYRSRLSFQDQLPDNPVIASDNRLVHRVIAEARARKIKIWLGAAVTYFQAEKFSERPYGLYERMGGSFKLPVRIGLYHTDTPGLVERAVQIFEEYVDLFPGVSGLCVELEGAGMETPERVPLYNRWAQKNNRRPFEQLAHPFNPRVYDVQEWREYTTHSRLRLLQAVKDAARCKGFQGEFAMICETGRTRYSTGQEVDLRVFHGRFPDWIAVTYEYAKWDRRYAMMDACIGLPLEEGLKVYYLPRGVMTWGGDWPLPLSLEQSWRRDVDDIELFRPNGVWWFGTGSVNNGAHVSVDRLRASGYEDGRAARTALLAAASRLRVARAPC